jgi:hypothetical protein
VNKTFYESARFFRDRTQTFYLEGTEDTDFCAVSAARIKALISEPSQSTRSIRHITIFSPYVRKGRHTFPSLRDILGFDPKPSDALPNDVKWNPISQLIAKTPGLKSFTFGAYEQIPLCITEALQKYHPKAELHIKNWTRTNQSQGPNDPAELALTNSVNLRSLQVNLGNPDGDVDLRRTALRRIVALAPNLEVVDISVNNTDGYPPIGPPDAWVEQQKRSAAFQYQHSPRHSIKVLKSQEAADVDHLGEVIALHELESLEINEIPPPGFFENISGGNRFPSLKHLSINPGPGGLRRYRRGQSALNNFLLSCQPLESLQLTCCRHIVPPYLTLLKDHGSRLHTLKLHEVENSRADITQSELTHILEVCPHLIYIEVDLDTSIDGSYEQDILCRLAKFPHLTTIKLHSGLSKIQSTPTHPFQRGDSDWIANIWSLLRKHKRTSQAAALQGLFIELGNEEEKGRPWEEREAPASQILATRSDRDDRPNEIVVVWKMKGAKRMRQVKIVPEEVHYPEDSASPVPGDSQALKLCEVRRWPNDS